MGGWSVAQMRNEFKREIKIKQNELKPNINDNHNCKTPKIEKVY